MRWPPLVRRVAETFHQFNTFVYFTRVKVPANAAMEFGGALTQQTVKVGETKKAAKAGSTKKQGDQAAIHGAARDTPQTSETIEVDNAARAVDFLAAAIDADTVGERDVLVASAVNHSVAAEEKRRALEKEALDKVDAAIADRIARDPKRADLLREQARGQLEKARLADEAEKRRTADMMNKHKDEVEKKVVANAIAAIDKEREAVKQRALAEQSAAWKKANEQVAAERQQAEMLEKARANAARLDEERQQKRIANKEARRKERAAQHVEVERQKSLSKERRLEKRAGKRAEEKVKKIQCYRCRQWGHVQADCEYGTDSPSSSTETSGTSSSDESSSTSSASSGFQQSKRKDSKYHKQDDAEDVAAKYGHFSADLKAVNAEFDMKVGGALWAAGTVASWAATIGRAVAPRLQSVAQVISEAVPRVRILGIEIITGPIAQATPIDAKTMQQMLSRDADKRVRGGIEAMTSNLMKAVSVAPLTGLVELTNTTEVMSSPTAGQLLAEKLKPVLSPEEAVAAGDKLDEKLAVDSATAAAIAENASAPSAGGETLKPKRPISKIKFLIRFAQWAGFAIAVTGLASRLLPPRVDYEFLFVNPAVAGTDDVRPSNQKARDAFFNDGQLATFRVTKTPAVLSGVHRLSRWVGRRNENAHVAKALRGVNWMVSKTQIVTREVVSLELLATCLNPRICANAASGGDVERIFTAVGMAAGTEDRINYDRHRAAADQVPASTARAAMAYLVSRGELGRFSF